MSQIQQQTNIQLRPNYNAPLDSRLVVGTKGDLASIEAKYPGMIVSVVNDSNPFNNGIYSLSKGGIWQQGASSGGGEGTGFLTPEMVRQADDDDTAALERAINEVLGTNKVLLLTQKYLVERTINIKFFRKTSFTDGLDNS